MHRLLLSLVILLLSCGTFHSGWPSVQANFFYPIEITPNFTGFNCDFEEGEECLWTWENDSFEGSEPAYRGQSWPGQHGFSRLNGFDVQRLFNRSGQIENAKFYGPHEDSRGRSDGHFLYLLGHPISSEEPVTDKRLISSLIKESGTECSLEMTLFYQGIRGAEIVVSTQNLYKAYSVSSRHVFQDNNATTHGRWAHMKMRIGRYLKPFSVSIEIKRHQASKPGSFIAMDAVVLDKCTPESSMPIDCSSSPREYYVCPDAQGVPCMPAASVLCDLHRDCPGGHDEDDPLCDAMPLGSQCDFNQNDSLCGWEVYSQSIDHQFSHENREWSLRSGGTKLGGINDRHQGNYLYLEYNGSRVGNFQTAMLRSPTFPPQPKYNANATSKYFESCRIRLSYHVMSESITPGFLDLYVHYKNDSSLDGTDIEHKLTRVSTDELMMDHYGWRRWEAVIPPMPQLRYNIFLVGSNGLGTRNEMAVDNITLSPQCFGLGVPQEELQGWRPSMTDKEFCQHYNRTQCSRPEKSEEYLFNSCKARRGAIGPTQEHCDDAYSKTNTKVLIGDPDKTKDDVHLFGYVTGIQRWKVPKTKMYSFIVSGASGAVGRRNRLESRADEIRAIMWLEANETIFILVGQQGNSYCPVNSIIVAEGRCDGTLGTLGSDRKKRYLMDDDRHMDNSHSHPRSPKKSADVRTIARIMSSTDNKHLNSGYVETPESELSDRTHHGQIIENEPVNGTHLGANDNIEMVRTESQKKVTYEGGGGGGGATIIFRIRDNHTVEPLFIAAGGGGASDHQSDQYGSPNINPDAKGYVHLKAKLQDLIALVSKRDMDAGSGGGWNRTLSVPIKFEEVFEAFEKGLRVNPAGFSSDNSWMGGLRCSPKSHQYGGFGGGGAGCKGGGGGGGFVGGKGGENETQNGEGGWSYFNAEAVVKILSPSSAFRNAPARGDIPSTWKHRGAGQVQIIEALPDRYCHTNCSSFGAVCMTFDPEEDIRGCVCPNGIILTHSGLCSDEIPMYAVIAYAIGCCLAFIMVAFCCRLLYMQYQRQHSKDLRRKMLASNGGGPDSQLHRIRAMTGMNGNGDMLLTEYNPNYEFGGGTFTLQDLLEIPRENLRIVKALGQGAFGEVYQGFYKKSLTDPSETAVAIKTLPELSSNQAEMDFLTEALIMSKFTHANIVHFIGVCFDKHPRFIVLELLAGGDLKTFLRESRPKPDRPSPLVMKDLLMCAMDVSKGCEYLEDHHFIHRDIAARNCLLTGTGPGRIVKIADFGMARDIYRADYYRKGGKTLLPVKWMPPEAFLDGIFTSKTDVWSFGILLWEVMSLGYMPYPGRGNQEVMQLVTNGGRLEPPNYCPGPVYGLMCQCWHPIPEERPKFKTILERLGYCMQDPEVVMAPLPMFHRPLSLDSRDTSASSGSGGRGVDTSAESGSGFSLPMRNQRTSSVPDSPSTLNGNGTSSDYLVPTNGSTSSKRPSFRSQSQSIESPMETEAQPVSRLGRNGNPLELETSFTKSPRRSDGYSTLPQADKQPDSVQRMELQKGRISNRAYGLSGVREPITQRMMSASKSTQPLLDDYTSPQLSPEHPQPNGHSSSVINPSFQGDRELANCPLGPLPPTPTDPNSSDAQTPNSHQSLSLDVHSLRGQNLPPLSMSQNTGYSSGPPIHVRDKYPYTIASSSKEEPKNEISV